MKLKQIFKLVYRRIFFSRVHYLKKELPDCYSALDLGCGSDSLIGSETLKLDCF